MGKRNRDRRSDADMSTIHIDPYLFDGPFDDPQAVAVGAGIVAVLSMRAEGHYTVVEAAESANLRAYVTSAARLAVWATECGGGPILFAVIYTPKRTQKERERMRDNVQWLCQPKCDTSDEQRPSLLGEWEWEHNWWRRPK